MSVRIAGRKVWGSTQAGRALFSSTAIAYPRRTNNQFSPFFEADPGTYSSTSGSSSTAASSSSSAASPSRTKKTPPAASIDPPPLQQKRSASLPEQTYEEADYDPKEALESARQRAWYIDEDDTPWLRPGQKPRFVTFDPNRTTEDVESEAIEGLPSDAPSPLKKLHEWMTSEDAAFVLDTTSVRFLRTSEANLRNLGPGEVITVEDGLVGAEWQWIVVAVAKGRGKGIVGRADRALRIWLHKNPLKEPTEAARKAGKLPRTPDWTDWSMVQIPEINTSVNIFTAEGRERWDLEEMWAEYDPNGKRKKPFGLRTRGWADREMIEDPL